MWLKVLLFYSFWVLCNSSTDTDISAHPNAVLRWCGLCECMGSDPYVVSCDNKSWKKVPNIEGDMVTQWKLKLQSNLLTTIPSFTKLYNLTALSFKYNEISKIDDYAFKNLTNLEMLELGNNNLTADSLSSLSFAGPYSDKSKNPLKLKILDLSSNHLNRLPKDVFIHLPNLTSLDLSHNPFVDFSTATAQAISVLHNLQILDLSYTRLLRLPDHFFAELTSLVQLDLSGNEFAQVPDEVNYAKKLSTLSINNNIFGALFGHSFWNTLQDLETLHMSKSKTLFRIEDGAFGNLTSLKALHLTDNPNLSVILPRAFTNSKNQTLRLQQLYLQNNRLESLPESALSWNAIPLLNLEGNPWNCDCRLEWLAKGVMRSMQDSKNNQLTQKVTCASPDELMGLKLTDQKVQTAKLVCIHPHSRLGGGYGFLVIATIVVGTLLLVTGTILFSYILFKRTKMQDWLGNNVKYRRTMNDDEEIVTSTTQY